MAFRLPEENRIGEFSRNVMYQIDIHGVKLGVIASVEGGWEHVSVSLKTRTPSWEEMCMIKDLFWGDEDEVVQFHPKRSEYVNVHPYALHMWRIVDRDFPSPAPGGDY